MKFKYSDGFRVFLVSDFCLSIEAITGKNLYQNRAFYHRLYDLTKRVSKETIRRLFCLGWSIDQIEKTIIRSDKGLKRWLK